MDWFEVLAEEGLENGGLGREGGPELKGYGILGTAGVTDRLSKVGVGPVTEVDLSVGVSG